MAMINCRECGADISSEAKACPHCGCPSKEKKQLPKLSKKMVQILSACVAVGLIIALIFSNVWRFTFDVQFFEEGNASYYYNITNKSKQAFEDLYAIIEVKPVVGEKFRFVDSVSDIEPNETIEYDISRNILRDQLEEHDAHGIKKVRIVKLVW